MIKKEKRKDRDWSLHLTFNENSDPEYIYKQNKQTANRTMGKTLTEDARDISRGNGAKKEKMSSEDLRSLANFMKKLREDHQKATSKVILPKIHKVIKHNKSKIHFNYQELKEKIKICKACDHWDKIKTFVQCSRCEDNYHRDCLNSKIWVGPICRDCKEGKKVALKCSKCKKKANSGQKRECESCQSVYHKKCWKKQEKTCRKCQYSQKKPIEYKNYLSILSQDTITSIRSPLFDYHHLVKNQEQLDKYTKELMEAIKEKGMMYTQQLVDLETFSDIFNEKSMDFGINFMSGQECRAYEEYKKMPIGPFVFRKIKGKGYDVVADKDIPAKSLICEYIGEVVSLRQCVQLQKHSQNDSLMELQAGKNANETLIIRPERFTNLARFINGVREDSDEGNVQSMKLLYKGKPLVLLVSTRPIKKGDSLSYDYNAGKIAAKYDTSYFK